MKAKTACNRCEWPRRFMVGPPYCIAKDAEVFDPMSGRMVKSHDMKERYERSSIGYPLCRDKNRGDCLDFKEEKVDENES